jgi:hypothetical protein
MFHLCLLSLHIATQTVAGGKMKSNVTRINAFRHVIRTLAPTLLAMSIASIAHAQGTMDFSGAQTLMGTFNWRNDYMAIEQWSRNILCDHYISLGNDESAYLQLSKTARTAFVVTKATFVRSSC